MKKLFLVMLLVAGSSFAGTAINASGGYQLNRHNKLFSDLGVGSQMAAGGWLKGRYQFSVQGGAAGADITLLDDDGRAAKLPDNAVIDDCMIETVEALTTADADGSVAFSSNAVEDLKAAVLIYPNHRTADTRVACLPTGNVSTSIKMGSEATLKMRIGSEAITGGKINVWVSYVVSN